MSKKKKKSRVYYKYCGAVYSDVSPPLNYYKIKTKGKKGDEHEREQSESGALTVSDTRTPQ